MTSFLKLNDERCVIVPASPSTPAGAGTCSVVLSNRKGTLRINLVCIALILSAAFSLAAVKPELVVAAARAQIGRTVSYDPAYRKLGYPNGDVAAETGVCSDVVVRALRAQGMDLQKEVHEDMTAHFSAYPRNWGLKKADRNIDHRRVPNLMTYFKRKGYSISVSKKGEDYVAGDIVTWVLPRGLTHIGVVSDRKAVNGTPLIIHNIGAGAQEEDLLFAYKVTGHYRVR